MSRRYTFLFEPKTIYKVCLFLEYEQQTSKLYNVPFMNHASQSGIPISNLFEPYGITFTIAWMFASILLPF